MSDGSDSVDTALRQYGLPANLADRETICAALREQIRLEADEVGDQFLMRLLCAQLFSIGEVGDALLIWEAKSCNFDTNLGIDVQFLCGAGLDQTTAFLAAEGGEAARDALAYVRDCESSGDFARFPVANALSYAKQFYGVG